MPADSKNLDFSELSQLAQLIGAVLEDIADRLDGQEAHGHPVTWCRALRRAWIKAGAAGAVVPSLPDELEQILWKEAIAGYPHLSGGDRQAVAALMRFGGEVLRAIQATRTARACQPEPSVGDPVRDILAELGVSKTSIATAMLFTDPSLSQSEIARRLGVSRHLLQRSERFMAAWRVSRLPDGPLPVGPLGDDGAIKDAWNDE